MILGVATRYRFLISVSACIICIFLQSGIILGSVTPQALLSADFSFLNHTSETELMRGTKTNPILSVKNGISMESSEENSDEDDDDDEEEEEDEEEDQIQLKNEASATTPKPQPVLLETKTVYLTHNHVAETGTMTVLPNTNKSEAESLESFVIQTPLPVRQKDEPDLFSPEEPTDTLLEILQNSVRETYLAFKGNSAKKKKEDMQHLEDQLKGQIQNLDIDLNAKIMSIDSNANSRITTLTEQIVSQRKEDILTFSDNLNQIAKANQVHLETLHSESQHLKVTVDALSKGQASLSVKVGTIPFLQSLSVFK